MTAVETIKFVRDKLIAQGKRCVDDDGKCRHQNQDGNHCAVGWLIPEGHPAMESLNEVESLLYHFPDLEEVILPSDLDYEEGVVLLVKLQDIHDAIDTLHWPTEFNTLLTQYGGKPDDK